MDFAAILVEMRARRTPEQIARDNTRDLLEARFAATEQTIVGYFSRKSGPAATTPPDRSASRAVDPRRPFRRTETAVMTPASPAPTRKTWEAPIVMRIEDRQNDDGEYREILRFLGAVTGHEAYRLDEDFCALISSMGSREGGAAPCDGAKEDQFCLCAGSDRYDTCHVATADIEQYLRQRRPQMFPATPTHAPGIGMAPI